LLIDGFFVNLKTYGNGEAGEIDGDKEMLKWKVAPRRELCAEVGDGMKG
jgi:hypothetical protein